MALIDCQECGKQISDNAKSCPECGCPIDSNHEMSTGKFEANTNKKSGINSKFIFIGLGALVLLGLLVYLDSQINTKKAIQYVFQQQNRNIGVKSVSLNNTIGKCKEFELTLEDGYVIEGITTLKSGISKVLSKEHYDFEILTGVSPSYRERIINEICKQAQGQKSVSSRNKPDDDIYANGRRYNKEDTVNVNGYTYDKYYGKPLYNEYGKQIQSSPY